MSLIEFKHACKVHRSLCPYRNTTIGSCQINSMDRLACSNNIKCWYMEEFKKHLRTYSITTTTPLK